MVRKVMCVKRGDLYRIRSVFMFEESRRADDTGVRAPIVVRKRGNARGAKGCRKVRM